ncbi:hypothetical protein QUB49_19360 [Microcoleus sp. AT9_B4]
MAGSLIVTSLEGDDRCFGVGTRQCLVLHRRSYMAGSLIVTSLEGDGVGLRKLREISSSNPVNFTRSPQSGHALA